jgi:hypothetical protein
MTESTKPTPADEKHFIYSANGRSELLHAARDFISAEHMKREAGERRSSGDARAWWLLDQAIRHIGKLPNRHATVDVLSALAEGFQSEYIRAERAYQEAWDRIDKKKKAILDLLPGRNWSQAVTWIQHAAVEADDTEIEEWADREIDALNEKE